MSNFNDRDRLQAPVGQDRKPYYDDQIRSLKIIFISATRSKVHGAIQAIAAANLLGDRTLCLRTGNADSTTVELFGSSTRYQDIIEKLDKAFPSVTRTPDRLPGVFPSTYVTYINLE